MANEHMAVLLPSPDADAALAPIQGIRFGSGEWIGAGSWVNGDHLPESMAVTVVGHGVARGRVRIAYTFANGGTGVVDVRLEADADHVEIREQWQLADAGGEPLAAWQFDLDQGAPRQAMWTTHGSGAGKAANEDVQRAPLADDLTRLAPVVVELIPRWNQTDDGWLYR